MNSSSDIPFDCRPPGDAALKTDGETVFSSRGALATGMENSLKRVRDRFRQYAGAISNGQKAFLRHRENPQGIRRQDRFIRVSWDEALELIHHQHQTHSWGLVRIDFAGSYGWRSNGVLH